MIQPQLPSTQLILRRESSGLRHYLDDAPVHAGAVIEVYTESTGWTLARYEWSFSRSSVPFAYIDEDRVIAIDDTTAVRWPEQSSS